MMTRWKLIVFSILLVFCVSSNIVFSLADQKSNGYYDKYPVLKKGSRGDSVKRLQEKLIEIGYLDDVADGVFGKKTEDAIKAFEEAIDFYVDGIAHPYVQDLIFQYGNKNENNEEYPQEDIAANQTYVRKTATYYKTWKNDKEYFQFTFTDSNSGTVKWYYQKNAIEPDKGTFTGNLDSGLTVKFEKFKDDVVFKYASPGDHSKINWIRSNGSVMATYQLR